MMNSLSFSFFKEQMWKYNSWFAFTTTQ